MNWLSPILILLFAYLAAYFEGSFTLFRNIFGVQIDLLPVLMVYASLTYGLTLVSALAVIGGLCFDSLSANPFGVSVLPLFLIGLVNYLSRSLLLRDNLYAQFVLGIGACLAAPLLSLIIILCLGQKPLLGWISIWQFIIMALAGGLLTPVCFKLCDFLNNGLNYQRVSESSFRADRQIKRGRF